MLKKIKNKKSLIILDQMLVSGSNFILGILLARYLGIEGYGQFALLWLVVLFFSGLQLAYVISPMLTLSGKKSSGVLDKYLSSIIFLQFFFLIFIIIGLYFFFEIAVYFNKQWDIGDLKLYIIFTTILFLFQDFIRRYFIIKAEYYKLIFLDSIAYLGQLGIVLYFTYIDTLELKLVFLAISISFSLSFIFGYVQIKKTSTSRVYKKLIFLKNWQISKWLVYTAILQWGSGNFFILASGAILGSWSVGVIRVMQNTMGVFSMLFQALENILPINLSKIYKKYGYKRMINYFKLQLKYGTIIFTLLALFISIFSFEIIGLLYGELYVEYSYLLVGFVFIYMFNYIITLQRYLLRTLELTQVIFTSYIATTAYAIISSSLFIGYFKIDGVLIGVLTMQLLTIIIFYKYMVTDKRALYS
jgi:O-antigen/teichoic acid export membrane protein